MMGRRRHRRMACRCGCRMARDQAGGELGRRLELGASRGIGARDPGCHPLSRRRRRACAGCGRGPRPPSPRSGVGGGCRVFPGSPRRALAGDDAPCGALVRERAARGRSRSGARPASVLGRAVLDAANGSGASAARRPGVRGPVASRRSRVRPTVPEAGVPLRVRPGAPVAALLRTLTGPVPRRRAAFGIRLGARLPAARRDDRARIGCALEPSADSGAAPPHD